MRTDSGFEREGKKECTCTRDSDRAGERGRATEGEEMRGNERGNIGRERRKEKERARARKREHASERDRGSSHV